jgi:hypothetical protein
MMSSSLVGSVELRVLLGAFFWGECKVVNSIGFVRESFVYLYYQVLSGRRAVTLHLSDARDELSFAHLRVTLRLRMAGLALHSRHYSFLKAFWVEN